MGQGNQNIKLHQNPPHAPPHSTLAGREFFRPQIAMHAKSGRNARGNANPVMRIRRDIIIDSV